MTNNFQHQNSLPVAAFSAPLQTNTAAYPYLTLNIPKNGSNLQDDPNDPTATISAALRAALARLD